MEVLFVIGDWVMVGALVGLITFTVSYGLFFSWRKTAAGRAIMYLALAMDAWSIQSLVARMNPDYFAREWIRLVVYIVVFVMVWGLVATLWRTWHRNTEKKDL